MSATQSSFGCEGTKSRPTRSAAACTPATRIVVLARFRGTDPESRCARISRSTRLRPTCIALLTKGGMDAVGAVGAATLAVDCRDPVDEPGIGESAI